MELSLELDLVRLVRIWRALIDYRLQPLKLTQTHWITLHNIYQLPPDQSQIQLAKAIGVEQPSLVRTLDQLELKGLIIRKVCSNDRRAKKIILTDAAKPVIFKVHQIINITKNEVLYGFSKTEIEQLNKSISKLEKNIINLYNKAQI